MDERAARYLVAPPGAPARVQVRGSLRALDLRWVAGDRRRFLIFAQGRAGGTLLGTLLDDHPQIACEGEVLYRPVALPRVWCHAGRARHRGVVYGCRVMIYQLIAFQRVRDPHRWLRRRWTRSRTTTSWRPPSPGRPTPRSSTTESLTWGYARPRVVSSPRLFALPTGR